MSETLTYTVPKVHCGHCAMTIKEEVGELEGVEDVDVDVDSKRVAVRGDNVTDDVVRKVLAEVGYPAE
jgi:copper chaperone CopZ